MYSCGLLRRLGLRGSAEYWGRLYSAANTNSIPDKEVPDNSADKDRTIIDEDVDNEDVPDEEGTSEDANADALGGSVRCTTS